MQPLEVGDDHAAGITEHVRDQLDIAALLDDFVGGVGGGSVGGFGQQPALELAGIFFRDDAFERRGYQHGAFQLEQLLVGNRLAAFEIAQNFLGADKGKGLLDIDAPGIVIRAGVVGDRNDFCPVAGQRDGGLAPDIAKALDGHGRLFDRHFHVVQIFSHEVGDAGPGRFATALRAAERDGFAGDDRGRNVADVVRISVHHPAHDFFVGPDIRGGNIRVRPDERDHLLHVTPGEMLEF